MPDAPGWKLRLPTAFRNRTTAKIYGFILSELGTAQAVPFFRYFSAFEESHFHPCIPGPLGGISVERNPRLRLEAYLAQSPCSTRFRRLTYD